MSSANDLVREMQARIQQLDPAQSSAERLVEQQRALAQTGAPGPSLRLSSSATLVVQMHDAFTEYLHGPEEALGHRAYLAGDLVQLEERWKARRKAVEGRGFLWGEWGEKLLQALSLFFPGAQLRQQTMQVARELEAIEHKALLDLQQARHDHYQDQFDTWRRVEVSRQTLVMIQGTVLQIANDIIVSVRGLPLSGENQEEMAKILFEKFAIPKLLQDLGVGEEE